MSKEEKNPSCAIFGRTYFESKEWNHKKAKKWQNIKNAQNSTRRNFAISNLVAEVIELKRTRKTVPPFLRDDHVDVEVDVDGFEREYSQSNDPETEQYRLRMGECPGSFL